MEQDHIPSVMALKAFAEKRAAEVDVGNSTIVITGILAIVIFLTDASFFFTVFSPMFQDEYGNYTLLGLLSNLLKAMISIGLIVTLGYAFEAVRTRVYGTPWDHAPAPATLGSRAAAWGFRAYIFAMALLSLYMLYIVGVITFGIAESQYAFASLNIGFALGQDAGNDAPDLAASVRKLAPIFVATAGGVAICIAELKHQRTRQQVAAFLRSLAQRCDAYIEGRAEYDAGKLALEYIETDAFLHEATARSHADLHDVTLASLQRVKGIILRASDTSHLPGTALPAGQQYLDDGLVLPQRQALLDRVAEAERKLGQLIFFLPRAVIAGQDSGLPRTSFVQRNGGSS